jgi:thioredoxin 1
MSRFLSLAITSSERHRTFFSRLTLMALLLVATCFIGNAAALTLKPYSADAVKTAQAKGQPIALHFHADWCSTCRAQQSALRTMETTNGPAVTVFVVDYDKQKALRRTLKVRSQSTFIVYRGRKETGRLAGDTDPEKIEAVLRTALSP